MTNITFRNITKDTFYENNSPGRPDSYKLSANDFTELGLKEFAEGISFEKWYGTLNEEQFFGKFNFINTSNLSTSEALLGLFFFDNNKKANTNVKSIDEQTVRSYLLTSEMMFLNNGFNDGYEYSLQYLFSAIEGITNTQAKELAQKLKGKTSDYIMTELFDGGASDGLLNDDKLNETVLNSVFDDYSIKHG